MIERCTQYWHQRKAAYNGCDIHPDFIYYQNFAEWCNAQIGFGKVGFQLDKDILVPGNRTYGPDTCCFVPRRINLLMIQNGKGVYPMGVSLDSNRGLFYAELSIDGKNKKLGRFETPEDAHAAYCLAKKAEVDKYAMLWKDQIDPRVYEALLAYDPSRK